ncbi:MAG: hypothetical protein ACJ8MH_16320, partial [Povalibacter sp.]
MSTQPGHTDLDKTDELPQLDVAAYEASLAGDDPLSSTDTWMVESLRESETVRELGAAKRTRSRPAPPLITGTVDLSIIDRLEQRIRSLESELNEAHAAESDWQQQAQSWTADRAALEQRLATFNVERERLEEQQGLSRELVQRLQRQLQDLTEQQGVQQAQMNAQREAHVAELDRSRKAFDQLSQQHSEELAQAAERESKLQLALETSTQATADRERELNELQRTLVTEQTKANSLGRHLAAKLADYDIMSSLVTQRNAKLAALESDRINLTERLERAQAETESLNQRLQELSLRAAEADRYASELGQREGQLHKVGSDLEQLSRDLQEAVATRQRAERTAEEALAQSALLEQQLQQSQRELAEADAMRDALSAERDELLPLRDDLA